MTGARATGPRAGLYDQPVHHGICRSWGELSSKIHQLVEGRGRPLVVQFGRGQANDTPMFSILLQHLRVARCCTGRPRTTPTRSSRTTLFPEPSDQIRNRARRGSRGGRRPAIEAEAYRGPQRR